MSVIGDLLSKIRGKRKEKFASKAQEYDSFVAALSRGDEVSVDELAELLDELDLSDSDLESDVKAKQRRHEIASQIRSMESTEKQLEKNERELQKLQDEIEQFLTPKKARVAELFQTVRMQQAEIGSKNSLIHDLQYGPTVPRNLQARRDELNARRKIWSEKERAYTERIDRPRTLAHQESMRIEVIDQKLSRCDASERELLLDAKSKAEQVRQGHQSVIDSLAGDKRELDAERAAIEAAERELNKQLLQP